MITLEQFKRSLGETGEQLPEKEMEKMMKCMYSFADILFNRQLKKVTLKSGTVIISHEKDGHFTPVFSCSWLSMEYVIAR